MPSRVYAFDPETGMWREPVLPYWCWDARGSGLVWPLPDGNLLVYNGPMNSDRKSGRVKVHWSVDRGVHLTGSQIHVTYLQGQNLAGS